LFRRVAIIYVVALIAQRCCCAIMLLLHAAGSTAWFYMPCFLLRHGYTLYADYCHALMLLRHDAALR